MAAGGAERAGQVYHGISKLAEAEEYLREAIALGREMGLAPRELVRPYHWLGETLWWQGRYEDQIRIGEEGLALLGADTESVEAVLMNDPIGVGHANIGNARKYHEINHRNARFIGRLPYTEELRPVYVHIIDTYIHVDRNVEETMKLVRALEEGAADHRDLRVLGYAHHLAGWVLTGTGDLHGAIARYGQGLELLT